MKTTLSLLLAFLNIGWALPMLHAQSSLRDIALNSIIDQVQPMTGIVFWGDNTGDLNQLGDDVQLLYSYMIYGDIVSQRGEYDWSAVEQVLNNAENRGQQAILRFRYTYPGVTSPSVPLYVRNTPGYQQQIRRVEGQNTYIPDWSSAELQDFTLEFYEQFAARYDDDPRLAFVQVGFGSYAEYHLYDGPLQLGQTFPSKDFQRTFVNHLANVFDQTHWSISIDAADGTQAPFRSTASLLNLDFGLFDDSFMHEQHSTSDSEYNRASWLFFGTDRYEQSPAGGEFNYYSDYDQEHVLDYPNGPYGRNFESFAAQYHITYMIGNDQLNYQPRSRIRQAGLATGYKFRITEFQSSDNASVVKVKNEGIAPFYYDAYPTVNGVRATTSLRYLLPGQSRTFSISSGGNNPLLTITSDRLVPGQTIQYEANLSGDGGDASGDYFYVVNRATGKKIRPNDTAEGALIVPVSASQTDDYVQWERVDTDQGFFYLRNKATGKHIRPANNDDDAPVEQRPNTWRGNYTQWTTVTSNNGYFYLKNRATGKYIRPFSTDRELIQKPTSYQGSWTQWKFVPVASGSRTVAQKAKGPSTVTEVISEESEVRLFPNPATDKLHVEGARGVVIIRNTIGQRVRMVTDESVIDVTDLPSGLYFVNIGHQRSRFIKQ